MDIALAITTVYVCSTALIFFMQRNLLYVPPNVTAENIAHLVNRYDPVSVVTKDGLKLTGFFTAPQDHTKPILLAFHGNASQPDWQSYDLAGLVKKGYGVLLAEYRGYAGNPGKPTEAGLYQDAEAYLDYLVNNPHLRSNPIVVYGQSIGSGPAVEITARHPDKIKALILEVPFDNLVNVVAKHYPLIPFKSKLLKDQYRSDDKIGNLVMPKLFILAGKDNVVGHDTGERLYRLAAEPKTLIDLPDANHVNVHSYDLTDRITEFLERSIDGVPR